MMLEELYEQLAPLFPATTRKDLKTAVQVYTRALQYDHPRHCPLDVFHRPRPDMYRVVEDYLAGQSKSSHTIRNSKNHLSRLFRLAEAQGLLQVVPTVLTPRFQRRQRPPSPWGMFSRSTGSYLPYRCWPPQLQADYTAFMHWASDPVVEGRDVAWRKRPITVTRYQALFEGYFGYLHHIRHIADLTFDQLFDFSLIRPYIYWHVNELHQRPTKAIRSFLQYLMALTRQYRPLPTLRDQLRALLRTLPTPPPRIDKSLAWVPLTELARIGLALWPRRQPEELQGSGTVTAVRAGKSLILRLWTYIPYRQRNIREMRLGDNLYQDAQGKWRIRFEGTQLKVAVKQGKRNVFDLPFPDPLLPALDAYLRLWRPRLSQQSHEQFPHVFLSVRGTPYVNAGTFRLVMSNTVFMYTGKHWYPHLVRSVWATEWIRNTHGDFYTAAIMLNDRLETVIHNYAHLLEEDVAERVYRQIQQWHTPPTGGGKGYAPSGPPTCKGV
jgi:hypothetical protein